MWIYKITNLINNKVYIGQTINDIHQRWNGHCNTKAKTAIASAIKKYGKDNFEVKIMAKANSIEELNHREAYYIKLLNTLSPIGYNLTRGGEGTVGRKHSIETKEKMSIAHKNKPAHNKGKVRTIAERKKISSGAKGRVQSTETRIKISEKHKNKKLSELTKQKLSTLNGGKSFIVKDVNSNIVWTGSILSNCAKALSLHISNISLCLHGKQKHHKGYFFTFEVISA